MATQIIIMLIIILLIINKLLMKLGTKRRNIENMYVISQLTSV